MKEKLTKEKLYTKQQVFELFKEYHQKSVVNHAIGDLIWKQTEEWLKTKNIIC